MRILLLSTYELGRQPFGLASPAAWLRQAGHEVECLDLAVQRLAAEPVARADAIALYLPMHTATRIALTALPRLRALNPRARLAAFGLYAPTVETELRAAGVQACLGGEFEAELTRWAGEASAAASSVSLARLDFRTPDRSGLPGLDAYARLRTADGQERIVGATEASRGCKHLCRHCPIVPIYGGRFRIVPPEVVLEDIAALVRGGAEHVTFGDADFFNGPGHAAKLVRGLHERFPELSYDVTIKVEHLLRHRALLPLLRDTGCALVTSAVESLDDRVLEILDKGHTRADFLRALELCREAQLNLQPTFVAFHPWASLDGHAALLDTLVELDLVGQVAPIQLAIRLLIPPDSRLLELPEVRAVVGDYDPALLVHPWEHADPRVDALQRRLEALVEEASGREETRGATFARIRAATEAARRGRPEGELGAEILAALPDLPDRATIPYLTEPWYC